MVLIHLEKLRKEFTDELVKVEDAPATPGRFTGKVGRVITVNANGRALVQFNGHPARYAIDVDDLHVVDPTVSLSESTNGHPGPRLVPVTIEYEPSALEKARLADGKAS